MENTATARPVPLSVMARMLRVRPAWLREEVAAGHLPAVQAGTQILFDADLVERLLLKRAGETNDEKTRAPTRVQTEVTDDDDYGQGRPSG